MADARPDVAPGLAFVRADADDAAVALAILIDAAARQAEKGARAWPAHGLELWVHAAIPRGELYLAWLDGQPAGTVTLQWADPLFWGERPADAGYVHKLAVPHNAAGKRLGPAILTWAEAQILAAGRDFVRLDCQADNPTLNRYYVAAGFKRRGEKVLTDGSRWSLFEKRVRRGPVSSGVA